MSPLRAASARYRLHVVGTLDGRTPIANADVVAGGLTCAQRLVVTHRSHGLVGDAVTPHAMVRFPHRHVGLGAPRSRPAALRRAAARVNGSTAK
jgi:hypothetical protein